MLFFGFVAFYTINKNSVLFCYFSFIVFAYKIKITNVKIRCRWSVAVGNESVRSKY